MYLPRFILAAVFTASCASAFAQNAFPPANNAIAQAQAQAAKAQSAQMNAMMDQMGPMFETMTAAMVRAQMHAAVDPKVADAIATFKRNLYDALRQKGFTAEDAMRIVTATPLPAAQVTGK